MLGAAAACRSNAVAILENPDHCFILVAALRPASSLLDIGDTLTIHAAFNGPGDCLPSDTTSAGVRWSSTTPASVVIDPVTAHVTARSPGWSEIYVHPVASQAVLGLAWVDVREPAHLGHAPGAGYHAHMDHHRDYHRPIHSDGPGARGDARPRLLGHHALDRVVLFSSVTDSVHTEAPAWEATKSTRPLPEVDDERDTVARHVTDP